MTDEIRQLAFALKALAESNIAFGGVLRDEVESRLETNRILGQIHDQNASILAAIERGNERHRESEKAIRVLQSDVRKHAERLVAVEKVTGVHHVVGHPGAER